MSLRHPDATWLRKQLLQRTPPGLRPNSILLGGGIASGALSGFIYICGCSRISFGAPPTPCCVSLPTILRNPPSPLLQDSRHLRLRHCCRFCGVCVFYFPTVAIVSLRQWCGSVALHGAVPVAVRQRVVDVWRAHGLEVPAAAQDRATASLAGWLYDAFCVGLAFSLLRGAATHVPVCSAVHQQPPRRCHVSRPESTLPCF